MKKYIIYAYRWFIAIGIDFKIMFFALKSIPEFFFDLYKFKKLSNGMFHFDRLYPCLSDRYDQSGVANGHYFHQDLLVAKKIYRSNPLRHIDIGSRVDGFVAHVATYRPIDVIDIRPLSVNIENINFIKMDLMCDIKEADIEICDSISCLHALEHFGLGRYGDPINFNGHIIGLNNISKLLKKGGKFYLSVPIGVNRIEFNAHRVFSMTYLLPILLEKFELYNFSYVNDFGVLVENSEINEINIEENYQCKYGCGIFELVKK